MSVTRFSPGEHGGITHANSELQLRTSATSEQIRARLAAVANELRIAAQGSSENGEMLLTLAQRFDEHATTGRRS